MMLRLRSLVPILVALALPAGAATVRVEPGPGALAHAIAGAAAGDELILAPGRYDGPVVLDRAITLDGLAAAVVDAHGKGSVITVSGPAVTVRGLEISGSGSSHETIDSGIRLVKPATGAVIENNRLLGNLYGIDVHGTTDTIVRGNEIVGRRDHRMNERGNGIYVWNAPGTLIEDNTVRFGRDGIFVNTSHRGIFRGNLFRDLRFGIHYMYANNSEVTGNVSIGNHLGYALMFSDRIRVENNLSLRDREHGLMLNYANNADIRGNLVRGGTKKCLFIYNGHRNLIVGNRFEGCDTGIHFTAGSERNVLTGNAFVRNRTQVKYVGTRDVEWSFDGRGNYWSDHPAFDLDDDGIADGAFRPNDLMDHILWSQPAAALLLGAPAVQLIRWSQSSFPATLPGGVVDSFPLTAPVTIPVPDTFTRIEAATRPAWANGTTDDADIDALATH